MYVTWNPEDGSELQAWNFSSGDVPRKQATQMERHFGGSWDQFTAALMTGQMQARAVLLWHMLTQVHEKLRFEDVPDFRVRQLTVEMGVAELKDLLKRVKKMKLPEEQREAFDIQFESDMREAMEREGYDPEVIDGEARLALEVGEFPKQA